MEWENVDVQEFIKKPKKVIDDRIAEINNFRLSQGWTQKNMAEYLEIPTVTYIQWENGTRTPPSYVLNLIKYKLKNDTKQIKLDLYDQKHFKKTVLELLECVSGKSYKDETDLVILKSYIKQML